MIKEELREVTLNKRKELTPKEIHDKSRKICMTLVSTHLWSMADQLFLYAPVNAEVDLTYLWDFIEREQLENGINKKVAYPKTYGEGKMDFIQVDKSTELASGRFNIPEPTGSTCLEPNQQTLILVPGVAFDLKKNRLGYGGGYYDRYIAKHQEAGAKLVGIFFEDQKYEVIPSEKTDQTMDWIFTEQHIYH